MLFGLLIRSVFVGALLSLPVGPAGASCIQHGTHGGFRLGLIAGLGCAAADAFLAFLGVSGATFIFEYLGNHPVFQAFSAFLLLSLGLYTWGKKPREALRSASADTNLFRAFLTTFFLALGNPFLIFGFAGFFTTADLALETYEGIHASLWVSFGVFAGATLCWILVAFLTARARETLSLQRLSILSKFLSFFLVLAGLAVLSKLIFTLYFS